MKLTLPLSAAAHAGLIALLFFLPAVAVSPPPSELANAISVVFAPPTPPAPPPPAAEQPPPPPLPVEQPPPPPPQPIEQPPPPPAPVAETPPPPPKPEPKPEPKPIPKPRPRPQPVQQAEQPMPQMPLPLPSQAPQMASIPSPPPAPTISPDYRTLLSGWLESHKRYPEDARQRGEEGRAVLRFRVDRYGRVIDYQVVSSTGFADLDQAVENMMRGATMPPFPPSMREPEIEVSVTIRYGLSR
ncbi:MAG TPA: energy transducer TonB [Stellaceae bacterium]|nr:energy transducer TonB [Stellaceae bacterium]